MSSTVLSQYPLSSEFRRKLQASLGETAEYISVSEIRNLGFRGILSRLRSVQTQRILIPIEDDGARAILPFLKILAGITPAKTIAILGPDFSEVNASRWSLTADANSIVRASLKGHLAAAAARNEVKSLLCSTRAVATPSDSNRVLYLNANLWFGVQAGGSVGHVAGVVNALGELGYAVDYASPSGNRQISDRVKYFRLEPPKAVGFPLENNHYAFNDSATVQAAKLADEPPRFIYQRMSLGNFTGVRLSRKSLAPLVMEYNGSEAWIAKNWGRPLKDHQLAANTERANLTHAHVVVTISEALKDELIRLGVEEERIACYPNCVDEGIFNPAKFAQSFVEQVRAAHGIERDAVVIGFVGTFGPWHGTEILAEAIAEIANKHKTWLQENKVHFLLVGDGERMSAVRSTLDRAGALPFCTLTGLVLQHQASSYLSLTDVLVSPHVPNADGSRFFGSPTKLFEYMAMGKAIVASSLEQIGDVLKNSLRTCALPREECAGTETELAVLAQPGDSRDLVRAIQFVVGHRAWRELLGRNARREALAKYTWKIHVRKFLERLDYVSRQSLCRPKT